MSSHLRDIYGKLSSSEAYAPDFTYSGGTYGVNFLFGEFTASIQDNLFLIGQLDDQYDTIINTLF